MKVREIDTDVEVEMGSLIESELTLRRIEGKHWNSLN